MVKASFALSSILIAHPQPRACADLTAWLRLMGVRDLVLVDDWSAARAHLDHRFFDLFITEVSGSEAVAAQFIQNLRHGDFGLNPFISVLATSWRMQPGPVRETLRSGVDDLLARPFTFRQVEARLNALILERRPFVVTAEYVGPDRRRHERGEADARKAGRYLFDAPNLFKAKVLGDARAVKAEENRIAPIRALVLQEKMRRIASHVAEDAAGLAARADHDEGTGVTDHDLAAQFGQIRMRAQLLRRVAEISEADGARALADQMIAVAQAAGSNGARDGAAVLQSMGEALPAALDPQAQTPPIETPGEDEDASSSAAA